MNSPPLPVESPSPLIARGREGGSAVAVKRRDFRESYGRRKHLRLEEGERGGFGNAFFPTWRLGIESEEGRGTFQDTLLLSSFPLPSRMTLLDTARR